jgi:UDP-2,3-diacylglucosamine hydrolase
MENSKKTYFVCDCHFGLAPKEESRQREMRLVRWLDYVSKDAEAIYILGDLFEFWFEYKSVVPKGYTRLFGKLASLTDTGIPIYFFRGNHDIWTFSYLKEELNLEIVDKPEIRIIQGKKFYLGHGDGLGKGDKSYKFLKATFSSKINQFLFQWLHPDVGALLGYYFSSQSKASHYRKGIDGVNNKGLKRLENYCQSVLKDQADIDFFIFGHVHKPASIPLSNNAKYISLGDWINHFSYAVFDGVKIKNEFFKELT